MGLFGLSPEDVQTLQQQGDVVQAQNAAQLPLGSGGVYASSIAGNMLGRGVAGALGYENPQMVKAQKFQQAMNETESSGIDYNRDPVGYLSTGVRNLMKYGLPEQAMVMADKLKETQQGQLYQAQAGHQVYQTQLSMEGQKRGQEIANAYPNDLPRQAAALMADPLTRDAGIKLRDDLQKAQTQKYQPLTEYGVLNTQTGETVGGGAAHTELGKYQAQQASLKSALKAATSQGQPQEVIDGIQKNLDETENKIKLISEGTPRSAMDERAMKKLTNYQLKVEGGQPLSRAEQIDADAQRAILSQERMYIDPTSGKSYNIQPLEVPSSITVGMGGAKKKTGIPTNQLPDLQGGRKALDAGTEKKFTDLGGGLQQMDRFASDFKPEFGGFKSETLAEGAIQAGRRGLIPKYTDMANYWQEYRQWLTDMRAAKFGMTLTGYELQAFKQYTSNPSDDPELIKRNMTRQLEIVHQAAQRELKALDVSGQNVKQGEALSNVQMGRTPKPPTGANMGNVAPRNTEIMRPSLAPPIGLDGWHIEIDGRGRKAWVSPDRKEFREIQ